MATEQETYNVCFTAGAAMLNEMYAVAGALLDCGGVWEKTKDKTFKENLMEKDKTSSNVRYFALMKQRLTIDLDDGVRVNYPKYYPLVEPIKVLDAKEE